MMVGVLNISDNGLESSFAASVFGCFGTSAGSVQRFAQHIASVFGLRSSVSRLYHKTYCL